MKDLVIKNKPYKLCCTFHKIPVLQTLENVNLTCINVYWDAILNYVKLANELL